MAMAKRRKSVADDSTAQGEEELLKAIEIAERGAEVRLYWSTQVLDSYVVSRYPGLSWCQQLRFINAVPWYMNWDNVQQVIDQNIHAAILKHNYLHIHVALPEPWHVSTPPEDWTALALELALGKTAPYYQEEVVPAAEDVGVFVRKNEGTFVQRGTTTLLPRQDLPDIHVLTIKPSQYAYSQETWYEWKPPYQLMYGYLPEGGQQIRLQDIKNRISGVIRQTVQTVLARRKAAFETLFELDAGLPTDVLQSVVVPYIQYQRHVGRH